MKRLLPAALAGLLVAGAALAAPGTVTQNSELRATPTLDGRSKGQIAAQSKVEILNTKGGWVEIKAADGKTGWVRLMAVEPAEAKAGGSGLKSLATVGNIARTGSTGTTAATGVKGISKEDLAAAQPNFGELAQLDRFRATPADGQQHARTAGLKPQDVEALPKP